MKNTSKKKKKRNEIPSAWTENSKLSIIYSVFYVRLN